jgi:hypothetical protein
MVRAAKYICGGNSGVHVIPCPAMLEPRRAHRFVYMYGSRFLKAEPKEPPDRVCKHGAICTFQEVAGNPAALKVFAGKTCGKANVTIEAIDGSGHSEGSFNLVVVNHDTAVCASK